MAASPWQFVCALDELLPHSGVAALIDGHQFAIFRIDDRVYALDNFDPHSRANVLSRGLIGDLEGELVVASPVYKHHFSLTSGRCLEEPEVRVPVFSVRVDDGLVLVQA